MTRSIIYNSQDLSLLTGVSISGIDYNDMPNRQVAYYPLARTDGSKQIAAFFSDRQITVFGQIIATDQPTFESNRQSLMQYLVGQDLPLDIVIGTIQQRFYATVKSVIFTDPSSGSNNSTTNAGLGVFTIAFECSSPFGIDPNKQTGLATTTITTTPSTQNLGSIAGSYQTAPYISVYLTSGTGFNTVSNYMKLTNVTTGKYIQITRAFSAGELLIIDAYTRQVYVNNAAVDFSGNLDLFWAIGSGGQIKYEDNFSTRSINLTFQYFPRYL